jgi:hypothetical protein
MNRALYGAAVIIIAGLCLYFFALKGDNPKETVTSVLKTQAPVSERLGIASKQEPVAKISPTQECVEYWKRLDEISDKAFDFVTNAEILKPKNCVPADSRVSKMQDYMLKVCKDPKRAPACQASFQLYLGVIADWRTQGIPIEQITDQRALRHKMISLLSKNPKGSAEAAERLLELDPKNIVASRTSVLAYYKMATPSRELASDSKESDWKAFNRALERHRSMGKEGEYFAAQMEIGADFVRGESKAVLDEKISELKTSYPDTGRVYYYEAWRSAQEGNKAQTLQLLSKAIGKEPFNPDFTGAFSKLKDPKQTNNLDQAFQFKN